ncbi:MAG: hypothetical protein F4Z20_10015 [Gammaproteobacteria bacterium]|nr:hypothetical protein [Gammaproteobacteria bacterium]
MGSEGRDIDLFEYREKQVVFRVEFTGGDLSFVAVTAFQPIDDPVQSRFSLGGGRLPCKPGR